MICRFLVLVLLAMSGLPLRAELFAPSSVSSTAGAERVSREQRGAKFLTTRQVKVVLRNMAQGPRTVGVECWMFYRDLKSYAVEVQHHERSVVTLAAGESRDVVADRQLFEYTPEQLKTVGHWRHSVVRRIPGSGHKYYGFVLRVYENGKVTNQISSASGLVEKADASWSSGGGR